MQPTVNSMHFLWAAYLLVAISNIAVVLWLAARWTKVSAAVNRKP